MKNKLRCVGGPKHGQFVDAGYNANSRFEIPVWQEWPVNRIKSYEPDPYTTGIKTLTYERRKVALGKHCLVEVWSLESMGEDEFMRRVADIIDVEQK